MIGDTIQNQIQDAMRARDKVRLSTLQMLKSALSYERIEKGSDLVEDDEVRVLKSEVKKRRDAIDAYQKAGRDELVRREQEELAILEEFLPEQMSDDDLKKLVDKAISETNASSMSDMGKVIGIVMKKAGAATDGSRVASLVKEKLS